MVTTPEEIEVDEVSTQTRVAEVTRAVIAGSPVGAVRRIVLYVIVAIALLPLATGGLAGILVGGVGVIALLLLAMTDELR